MRISLDPRMLIVNRRGVFGRGSDEPSDVSQFSTQCVRSELMSCAQAFGPDVVLVDLSLGRKRAIRVGYALKEELDDALVLLTDQSGNESAYYRLAGDLQAGFISTFAPTGFSRIAAPAASSRPRLVSVS